MRSFSWDFNSGGVCKARRRRGGEQIPLYLAREFPNFGAEEKDDWVCDGRWDQSCDARTHAPVGREGGLAI